jgi:hypothetical protein
MKRPLNLYQADNKHRLIAFNLDARTCGRLEQLAQIIEQDMGVKAAPSVLVRRALEVYAQHVERTRKKKVPPELVNACAGDPRFVFEVGSLKRAARGSSEVERPKQPKQGAASATQQQQPLPPIEEITNEQP